LFPVYCKQKGAWSLKRHHCNVKVFHFSYLHDEAADEFQNLICSSFFIAGLQYYMVVEINHYHDRINCRKMKMCFLYRADGVKSVGQNVAVCTGS